MVSLLTVKYVRQVLYVHDSDWRSVCPSVKLGHDHVPRTPAVGTEVIESKDVKHNTEGDARADAVHPCVDDVQVLDSASSEGMPLQRMLAPVVESRL
jgi:hypothetical protein